MKKTWPVVLALIFAIGVAPVFSQNKKIDKSLQKIDSYFAGGNLSKANSSLQKLKKSVTSKMGQQNAYMPGLYLREARINMALGVFSGFENTLINALSSSQAMYGDNSSSYASTLVDVA